MAKKILFLVVVLCAICIEQIRCPPIDKEEAHANDKPNPEAHDPVSWFIRSIRFKYSRWFIRVRTSKSNQLLLINCLIKSFSCWTWNIIGIWKRSWTCWKRMRISKRWSKTQVLTISKRVKLQTIWTLSITRCVRDLMNSNDVKSNV